jgi:NAD(P)-dependent dehydrogenase (short-subunit alcohol dehydrogenase family)
VQIDRSIDNSPLLTLSKCMQYYYIISRESFEKDFGYCDILVNNAGMAFKGSDPTPFAQQARPTFATNYFGTSQFSLAMLPLLK